LCLEKWKIYEELDTPQKKGDIYLFCLEDEISIKISDPMLGRWAVIEHEPCPVCGEKIMRMFFRSDEYIKMKCHKCKTVVESVDDKKHEALIRKEEMDGLRKTVRASKTSEDGQ
jgi:phage FluMu protein Com